MGTGAAALFWQVECFLTVKDGASASLRQFNSEIIHNFLTAPWVLLIRHNKVAFNSKMTLNHNSPSLGKFLSARCLFRYYLCSAFAAVVLPSRSSAQQKLCLNASVKVHQKTCFYKWLHDSMIFLCLFLITLSFSFFLFLNAVLNWNQSLDGWMDGYADNLSGNTMSTTPPGAVWTKLTTQQPRSNAMIMIW